MLAMVSQKNLSKIETEQGLESGPLNPNHQRQIPGELSLRPLEAYLAGMWREDAYYNDWQKPDQSVPRRIPVLTFTNFLPHYNTKNQAWDGDWTYELDMQHMKKHNL